MRISLRQLLLLILVGAALFLSLRWPRLNDVETGSTAAYPEAAQAMRLSAHLAGCSTCPTSSCESVPRSSVTCPSTRTQ